MEEENFNGLKNTETILNCVRSQHESTVQRNNNLDTKINNLYLVVLAIVPICASFFDIDSLLNNQLIIYKVLIALFLIAVLASWIILLKGSLQKKYLYRFGVEDFENKELSFYEQKNQAELNIELIRHFSEAIHKNYEIIKLKVGIVKKTQSCLFVAIILLLTILLVQIF